MNSSNTYSSVPFINSTATPSNRRFARSTIPTNLLSPSSTTTATTHSPTISSSAENSLPPSFTATRVTPVFVSPLLTRPIKMNGTTTNDYDNKKTTTTNGSMQSNDTIPITTNGQKLSKTTDDHHNFDNNASLERFNHKVSNIAII